MKKPALLFLSALAVLWNGATAAAELKVLTAGAMEKAVTTIAGNFERASGHNVTIAYDTVGALTNRIRNGEAFDVAVMTPEALNNLAMHGKVVGGSVRRLAQTGIGVMVRTGAPAPDISTVDAFRAAILAAPTVGYIDPAAGGSSGIYFNGLIDRLGIGAPVRAKARLKQGGAVAEFVASGEAAIGIHQISEITGFPGVTLIGPLPRDIQNYTVYGAGIGTGARDTAAARELIDALGAAGAASVYQARGMELAQ
jgi:molybdate transport system substrate-binding protein